MKRINRRVYIALMLGMLFCYGACIIAFFDMGKALFDDSASVWAVLADLCSLTAWLFASNLLGGCAVWVRTGKFNPW